MHDSRFNIEVIDIDIAIDIDIDIDIDINDGITYLLSEKSNQW
jgi:hypothetical protein